LLGDQLGQVSVSAVIHHIGRLVFQLRKEFDSRDAFSHRFSPFRRGARPEEFDAGKHQAANDPDKNAELDRNKMCNFQVHFPKPPPGEIFSETVRYNNLKIYDAGFSCGLHPIFIFVREPTKTLCGVGVA
jgi:hypothetical protein